MHVRASRAEREGDEEEEEEEEGGESEGKEEEGGGEKEQRRVKGEYVESGRQHGGEPVCTYTHEQQTCMYMYIKRAHSHEYINM